MKDESKQYIKMCTRAGEIRMEKYEEGFTEGDYIYDGKSCHILGHDYIGVKNLYEGEYHIYHNLRYCLRTTPLEVSYKLPGLGEIEILEGTYEFETLFNVIWLPRQDQLQEMIEWKPIFDGPPIPMVIAHGLYNFAQIRMRQYCKQFSTMEQLWLAFVMQEKYQKVWSGEDWI